MPCVARPAHLCVAELQPWALFLHLPCCVPGLFIGGESSRGSSGCEAASDSLQAVPRGARGWSGLNIKQAQRLCGNLVSNTQIDIFAFNHLFLNCISRTTFQWLHHHHARTGSNAAAASPGWQNVHRSLMCISFVQCRWIISRLSSIGRNKWVE